MFLSSIYQKYDDAIFLRGHNCLMLGFWFATLKKEASITGVGESVFLVRVSIKKSEA